MTRFQKTSVATTAVTLILFSSGGLVRGTGSGLGCSTWPHCEPDSFLPSGTMASLIEFSHRFLAGLVGLLILATAIQAWRHYRRERSIVVPAVAALPVVLIQAALGARVVFSELEPAVNVTSHFVVATLLTALVVITTVNGLLVDRAAGGSDRRFARIALVTAVMTGLLMSAGTWVRATGASLAFSDWPLMDGRLVPTLGGTNTVMFLHRVFAALAFLLVIYAVIRARTMSGRSKPLVMLSTIALLLFVAQILVGAANIWSALAPIAVIGHVALSVLIWATVVALATAARRLAPEPDPAAESVAAPEGGKASLGDTAAAYFQLTKPRIISLLLITTVPAMILAAGEVPSLWLIAATLLGGTLAAGSANAINCYIDRDIDQIMKRTRRRPLPAHEVTPDRALAFGYVLGAISFFFLAMAVNVLAATLCLAAIVFYVFVYTLWLKRSTDQNIVIGGAAGAAPVLVGWAAVTGTVQLPAIVLFAVVFIWTPPHFWALAMRFRNDYAAAGVPMMPAVRGQQQTLLQIWLYSLALFAVTLVMVPVASMGLVYTITAALLGGSFVYRALRLRREYSEAAAMRLFRFSIVYLALLFGAVAVDGLMRGAPIGA